MALLITVLSLLVAVYRALPGERRLDLRLRFGLLDGVIAMSGVAVVAYLDMYTFFKAHGLTLTPPMWTVGLTTDQLARVVLLALLVLLGLRGQFARLTTKRMHRFQQLADELLWSQGYLELLLSLETHLGRLFAIYHANGWLQRLKRRYAPQRTLQYWMDLANRPPQTIFDRVLAKVCSPMLALIPEHADEQVAARQTAQNILQSRGFVSVLAGSRPYLGIEVIMNLREHGDKFFRQEFVELYISELLSNRSGVFYTELANSWNTNANHRYEIPASNRLLTFLFRDAKIAQELEVYRPVGEYVLRELDELSRAPAKDPYNHAFREDDQRMSQSPLFAGVHFFDVMVSEPLLQGITWHMWLYYSTHMVEKIVGNYQPADDPLIQDGVEFPIYYSRLLYDIFGALRDWILGIEYVPANQENIKLVSTRPDHQNDNIPKSSVLALGICVRTVLLANNLDERLKETLLSVVFRTYFELRRAAWGNAYAEVLRRTLLAGGFLHSTIDLESTGFQPVSQP